MARTFNDQLRSVIRQSGLTNYEIHRRCGIDQGALARFRRRQVGLTTVNVERLTKLFRLQITADRPDGGTVRGKKRKGQ